MGARNRGGIGLSYRSARLHRLAEKYGLWPELTELFLKRLNYTVPDNDGWKVYSVILIVPMCENWHAQLCNGMSVLVVVCISLVFAFVTNASVFLLWALRHIQCEQEQYSI